MSEDDDVPQESGAPNVADPVKVATRRRNTKRKVKQIEAEQHEFWNAVLASPLGRREMWGILASGHAFDERFVAGPNGFPCSEATWCEAGEQRLAFRIYLSWMKLAPKGVALMLAENHPALEQPKEV